MIYLYGLRNSQVTKTQIWGSSLCQALVSSSLSRFKLLEFRFLNDVLDLGSRKWIANMAKNLNWSYLIHKFMLTNWMEALGVHMITCDDLETNEV